ncbi:MAG: hypothetical protein R3342_13235 [Lutibacter sp.]|uniref:hypothetical protein n=1 Tax=Lutibacter sp. TaxID=1925666 RepID=UPI00299D6FF1|nr:hypothetical protein [Lutibacter sp.]MDX1830497.1 hypothetical protein [Lutibacter sp.]
MKKISIGLFLLFILIPNINYSQVWPFTPMLRFGNTVYYKIPDKNKIELNGINKILDKDLENRYFDIVSKERNIQIKINDSIFNFTQKERKEPKNKKEILFYSKRKLTNKNLTIYYLKLIEFTENSIIAQADIKYLNGKTKRRKEIVEIDKNQIRGIFLGNGKNIRLATSILSIGAGITVILIM